MKFKKLNNLYKYLDEYALMYHPHIKDTEPHLLKTKYRDIAFINNTRVGTNFKTFTQQDNIDENEKELAIFEMLCFHLWSLTDEFAINHFRNFRIDYVSVYTTRNSIKTKYLDYLVKRISESTNEGLIVRYAHLLFHFKEEQEEKVLYAKIAIDNYLKLLKSTLDLNEKERMLNYSLDEQFNTNISQLLFLGKLTSYRIQDIRYTILHCLRIFGGFSIIYEVIEYYKSIFKKDDLKDLQEACLILGVSFLEHWEEPTTIQAFELGLQIGQIIGEEYNWERLIKEADLFEENKLNWEESIFKEMDLEKPKFEN